MGALELVQAWRVWAATTFNSRAAKSWPRRFGHTIATRVPFRPGFAGVLCQNRRAVATIHHEPLRGMGPAGLQTVSRPCASSGAHDAAKAQAIRFFNLSSKAPNLPVEREFGRGVRRAVTIGKSHPDAIFGPAIAIAAVTSSPPWRCTCDNRLGSMGCLAGSTGIWRHMPRQRPCSGARWRCLATRWDRSMMALSPRQHERACWLQPPRQAQSWQPRQRRWSGGEESMSWRTPTEDVQVPLRRSHPWSGSTL
jgi:hypothetical protein